MSPDDNPFPAITPDLAERYLEEGRRAENSVSRQIKEKAAAQIDEHSSCRKKCSNWPGGLAFPFNPDLPANILKGTGIRAFKPKTF